MVNNQVLTEIKPSAQEINKAVITRKLDLSYDLETILEKLQDKIEK